MPDAELLQLKSTKNMANSYYYANPDNGPRIEYGEDGKHYTLRYPLDIGGAAAKLENSRAKQFEKSLTPMSP